MTRVAGTTTVWRRCGDVLSRRTPRSVLLTTSKCAQPLVLEGAAISVWDALELPATDDALVVSIAARSAVGVDDVKEHVLAARVALADVGAIVGSDD